MMEDNIQNLKCSSIQELNEAAVSKAEELFDLENEEFDISMLFNACKNLLKSAGQYKRNQEYERCYAYLVQYLVLVMKKMPQHPDIDEHAEQYEFYEQKCDAVRMELNEVKTTLMELYEIKEQQQEYEEDDEDDQDVEDVEEEQAEDEAVEEEEDEQEYLNHNEEEKEEDVNQNTSHHNASQSNGQRLLGINNSMEPPGWLEEQEEDRGEDLERDHEVQQHIQQQQQQEEEEEAKCKRQHQINESIAINEENGYHTVQKPYNPTRDNDTLVTRPQHDTHRVENKKRSLMKQIRPLPGIQHPSRIIHSSLTHHHFQPKVNYTKVDTPEPKPVEPKPEQLVEANRNATQAPPPVHAHFRVDHSLQQRQQEINMRHETSLGAHPTMGTRQQQQHHYYQQQQQQAQQQHYHHQPQQAQQQYQYQQTLNTHHQRPAQVTVPPAIPKHLLLQRQQQQQHSQQYHQNPAAMVQYAPLQQQQQGGIPHMIVHNEQVQQHVGAGVARLAQNEQVQTRVADGVSKAAHNREVQHQLGQTIASNSDNYLIQQAAQNETIQRAMGSAVANTVGNREVQRKAGQAVANLATNRDVQKKVASGMLSAGKFGFSASKTLAKGGYQVYMAQQQQQDQ